MADLRSSRLPVRALAVTALVLTVGRSGVMRRCCGGVPSAVACPLEPEEAVPGREGLSLSADAEPGPSDTRARGAAGDNNERAEGPWCSVAMPTLRVVAPL